MDSAFPDPRHCILTRQYAIYTPPIHEMTAVIGDWIDQRRPGGFIYGASRLGKSRAVQWYLAQVLEERFGAVIPLIVWTRRSDHQPTESAFWHALLLASKFKFSNPAKPPKKSEGFYLCVQRFIAIAQSAGRNHLVLLIDEAQDVTLREWKWLVGLQNQLDYEGFLLSVVSVGTHQLGYRHEYLASTGNAHIAARFMSAHYRFHGIRSVEEVAYVLNGYDVDSEWPAGSGKSFLKYFSPTNFSRGRRLSECADSLWEALIALRPSNARNFCDFPMEHIAFTVENMLKRLASGGDWDETTSYQSWLEGLTRNNFSDHMRVIATTG